MMNRNKETQRLQALVDEQAEQIDSLLKTVEALVIACEQAASDEREACAKLCDEWFAGTAAVDIRARGEK